MKKVLKKTRRYARKVGWSSLIVILLSTSLFSSLLVAGPQKTYAQGAVPVAEFPTSPVFKTAVDTIAKEGIAGVGLDTLAWQISKRVIDQITRSLVDWINSGFQGNPAFIDDPLGFFEDLADQVLGEFIEGTELGFLCSPFQIEIKRALILSQNRYASRVSCTLSDVLNNIENFEDFVRISDLSVRNNTRYVGGWEDWYAVAAKPGGNIYGAFVESQAELALRISTRSGTFEKELNWGDGFLSYRDCTGVPPSQRGAGNSRCRIVTPGKVIEDQLATVLGSGVRQLELADEFNEIVGALISQLLTQVFGGGGLFGLSQPNSNYGGSSYTSALSGDTSGISSTRDLSNQGINQNISVLNQYILTKNQSISRVNTSINIQNQVRSVCGAGSGNSNNANSIITNNLQPLRSSLQADVTNANLNIAALENFRIEFNALAVDDLEGLQELQIRYLQFLTNIQIDYITQLAAYERDYTIPQQLNSIDSNAREDIRQCQQQNNSGGGRDEDRGGDGGRDR